jgi:ribosomal protein S18 acetylase RimI-like enzyme
MRPVPYVFRDIEPADADFLTEMLRLTLAWHLVPAADGSPPPVLVPPRAFADLGRAGDGGVVATYAGEPAGACWYRINLTAREHDGAPVPELLIAVRPEHRAQGIGGQLLDRGIEHARAAGHAAIDLVVELDNPARAMYLRRGFEPLGGAPDVRDLRKLL